MLPIWGFQLLTKGRGCECRDFVDETVQERMGWEKAGRREPSENMEMKSKSGKDFEALPALIV